MAESKPPGAAAPAAESRRLPSVVCSQSTRRPSTSHTSKPRAWEPLDGGWGWMVVLGCSLGHFFLVGLARTLGVFFVAWVDRFEGSAAATAWVQSLFNMTRMVAGPLVSMLCDTFGVRIVVIIGGVIFSIGCLVSSFATSLLFLYFSFSLLGGIGAGLVFTPMFVIVNQYFEKKKGIAMSLATMGSGLGTLVLANLETALLEAYGHYGAMLIISGLMMNCIVVGALFRPLESKLNRRVKHKPIKMQVIVGADEVEGNGDVFHEDAMENQQTNIDGNSNPEKAPLTGDMVDTDEDGASHSRESAEIEERGNSIGDDLDSAVTRGASLQKSASQGSHLGADQKQLQRSPSQLSQGKGDTRSLVKRSSSQKLENRSKNNSVMKRSASQVSRTLMNKSEAEVLISRCDALKERFSILRSWTFWIYSFYIAALPCGVQIYLVFTPSLMKERGLTDKHSALVLSIAGGFDIAGRFLAGFLFDLNIIRSRRWPTHCCYGFMLGVVLILNSFQNYLVGFIAMSLLWGLFEGGYHSQRATIVSEFITRDQIASSVGFMIFWQGIGNLMSPTFAGFLKDKYGTFNVSFYYGGAAMMFCSLLFLGAYVIVQCRQKQEKKKKKQAARLQTATA